MRMKTTVRMARTTRNELDETYKTMAYTKKNEPASKLLHCQMSMCSCISHQTHFTSPLPLSSDVTSNLLNIRLLSPPASLTLVILEEASLPWPHKKTRRVDRRCWAHIKIKQRDCRIDAHTSRPDLMPTRVSDAGFQDEDEEEPPRK